MTDYIQEIKNRITIYDIYRNVGIDVRGTFITSIYKQEKTPSLKIYGKGESYYCFATNQGGDVIDFYEALYNVDTATAVKELKALAGLDENNGSVRREVTMRKDKGEDKDKDVMECMTEYEKDFYNERLTILAEDIQNEDVAKSVALVDVKKKRLESNREVFEELYYYCITQGWDQAAYDYLTKIRKIREYDIEAFKIFYIKNYNQVNNHLKKQFGIEQLQKSGLFNKKEDGSGNLIFYQHPIVIPYLYGKTASILYLRARFFSKEGNEPNGTKYMGLINDALNVNTSKRFYNDLILDTMIPGEPLYIVEGEFDAIILQGMGYNAICIPGAGNMPDKKRFMRLRNFSIIVCVDNDSAGSKLLDGWYYTIHGEKKYSDKNLMNILKEVGVEQIRIKKLPSKDVNDFVMSLEGK